MATINEGGLTYWEEKELEAAMKILPVALGFNDRAATFDPVGYALMEARNLITRFRESKGVLWDEEK